MTKDEQRADQRATCAEAERAMADRCRCEFCKPALMHWSDCAVHGASYFEAGPCNCGGFNIEEIK